MRDSTILKDRVGRAAMVLAVAVLAACGPLCAQHQTDTVSPVVVDGALPYYLQLRVYDQDPSWLPTLHSFAQAQHDGKWLLLAGRTNGLHDLTHGGMMAFPTSAANRDVWVIDPVTRQSWHRSLNDNSAQLDSYVVDALSSTNTQFYQAADRLYVTGGYGHRPGEGFKTFDTLTAIDVPGLIDWVQNGSGRAADSISQIRDPLFQVTDNLLPFVNQVTSIVRDAESHYTQYLLSGEFPELIDQMSGKQLLFGANAEFMISPAISTYDNDIIQFDALTRAASLGYIFGGIVADAPNRGETAASNIIFEVVLTPLVAGDFDRSGQLDIADLDELDTAIRAGGTDEEHDLNLDQAVDSEDRRIWVVELRRTYFGDADLNGQFDSSDMVQVFTAGRYETGQEAGWAAGDWDGNGIFDSGDMVAGFVDGGYEQGQRTDVHAIPEPATPISLIVAAVILTLGFRWPAVRTYIGS